MLWFGGGSRLGRNQTERCGNFSSAELCDEISVVSNLFQKSHELWRIQRGEWRYCLNKDLNKKVRFRLVAGR